VTHRIGIIGFGGFGRFLAKAWSGVEGVRLTAIADVNPDARQEGIAQFADWRRLLDSGEVDVVSVVTPPATHPEIAAEALRRGVHVLVEKPIAVSVADAQQVLTADRDSSATATVDFMLRYNPIIECVHGWCREKTFGALQRVVVENYAQDESLTADHWFWNPDISGGILIEHAVHFIDVVNGCTSSPVDRVDGRSWRRVDGRVDRMALEARYDDGLVAAQYHAFNRLEPFERTSLRFVFDGAQIDVEGWIPMKGRVIALLGQDNENTLEQLPGLSIERDRPLQGSRNVPLANGEGQGQVRRMVEASFEIPGSKEEAYLDALRKLMSDFLQATGPDPKPIRVTLADGLKSLEIACAATAAGLLVANSTESANPESGT
ncbi:MAG: Gfo/Idh/MocA family oxidoreductase, partial [Rhodothermales bacterium]